MAEQLIRNEQVVSSILTISSNSGDRYGHRFFFIFICLRFLLSNNRSLFRLRLP